MPTNVTMQYSPCTVCPTCSDAKIQMAFILKRNIVFGCHFNHSYYYFIEMCAANFHKIAGYISRYKRLTIYT